MFSKGDKNKENEEGVRLSPRAKIFLNRMENLLISITILSKQ